jgi:transglutaminase-like putative cysteine protease
MIRPRDSHEMRLHGATLTISPQPSQIVWQYDVVDNSIALVDFAGPAAELMIESTLDVERFPYIDTEYLVADHARKLPLSYSAEEIRDLAGLQGRHVPDPEHVVDRWAKGFLVQADDSPGLPGTLPVLNAMAAAIKRDFTYQARDAYGTQAPPETLRSRSGTCRDFAT